MEKRPKTSKVKVIVRVRPQLNKDAKTCLTVDSNNIHIVNYRNKAESLQYEFSSVYNENSTQQTIFSEAVYPSVRNAFNGENVSVFAYGPTGAGKTHTMLGVLSDPGIIPRTVQSVFTMITEEVENALAQDLPAPQHTVQFGYLEIYNEKVQDLLKAGNSDLPIREDSNHNIFVAGLTEKTIQNFDDFKNSFGPASSNRTVAATKLNEASSRSHSLLMLKILRRSQGKVYRGKIYLIDLAGSEDNRRTGNQGIRMKESAAINKSLFALGEVVDSINSNQIRIPYRNSKLTRLLQDSIGGSCHSVMITNIAPEQSYYYDSYCTLNFATKSKKIVNVNTAAIKVNSPPPTHALVKPTAQLRPTKRKSEHFQAPSKAKKSRRSSIAKIPGGAPSTSFSPLVRRQEEFECGIKEKVERMERMMQEKLSEKLSPEELAVFSQLKEDVVSMVSNKKSKLSSSVSTPTLDRTFVVPTPKEKRKSLRLASSSTELHDVATSSKASTSTSMDSSPLRDVSNVQTEVETSLESTESPGSSIIEPTPQEKKNVLFQHYLKGKGKEKKASKLHLKPVKNLMDTELDTFSPLFPAQKKKDFLSVGATPKGKVQKAREAPSKFVNGDQMLRNTEFLQTLNTADAKNLQKLQTIGVKKAQLILNFRTVHGDFDFIDDLKKVPGFTDKFVTNLLKANVLTNDDL